ncbi:MAG: peptide-binding protein, partial [Candidatus Methylomirabilales bacterium]
FNQERRKAIYGELQRVLAEDQPVVFLYVPDALMAVSSRIRGIEPAPAGIAWNFIRWYVPAELQRYTR